MGSKEKRLPVRIQKIVGACKAGETLCLHIKHSEVGDERVFWLEPSGRPAGTKSAQEAAPRIGRPSASQGRLPESSGAGSMIRIELPFPIPLHACFTNVKGPCQ